MNLRIVREKRGDLVTGFRVQKESSRGPDRANPDIEWGNYWRNIGRKCYSVAEAQEYRDFLLRHLAKGEYSVEVIEEESNPTKFDKVYADSHDYGQSRGLGR